MQSAPRDAGASQPNAAEVAAASQALFAVAKFENSEAIATAYGSVALAMVRQGLADRAARFVGAGGVACWAGDRLLILITDPTSLAGWMRLRADRVAAVEGALVRALVVDPFDFEDGGILAAITLAIDTVDTSQGLAPDALASALTESLFRRVSMASPRSAPVLPDKASRHRFRFDMANAALVARCIRDEAVTLAWQAVGAADPGAPLLYREGLLRLLDSKGDDFAPSRLIGALEELGLVRALDAHVVGLVIERLRADPRATLGCNISAQSAVLDGWWAPLLAVLKVEPEIAARLVVEITETAPFVNTSLAVEFVDRLRSLGCRIAIDDFGIGYASIRNLHALKPEIVKIDGLYLKLACGIVGSGDTPILAHLVGLARALAPTVVVEGVEDAEMLATAQSAGAEWFQGHLLGRPSLVLSQRTPPPEPAAMPDEPISILPELATPRRRRARAARFGAVATVLASVVLVALHFWSPA